jgi:hypothetical protein
MDVSSPDLGVRDVENQHAEISGSRNLSPENADVNGFPLNW